MLCGPADIPIKAPYSGVYLYKCNAVPVHKHNRLMMSCSFGTYTYSQRGEFHFNTTGKMLSSRHSDIQCFTETGNMQTEHCGSALWCHMGILCISCLLPLSFFTPPWWFHLCLVNVSFLVYLILCAPIFLFAIVIGPFVCFWVLLSPRASFDLCCLWLPICWSVDFLPVPFGICLPVFGLLTWFWPMPTSKPCVLVFIKLLNYISSASGVCISVLLPFLVIFCTKFIPVLTTLLKNKMLLHKWWQYCVNNPVHMLGLVGL